MANTGFTLAGTGANNADAGNTAWSNPGNITADDGSRASSAVGGSNTSQYLHATNFGFAIPTGATINGIQVRVQQLASNGSNGGDHTVQLIKGGTRSGDNNAEVAFWPTSDTNHDYGGTADLWGLTLTPADANASNFGVAARVNGPGGKFSVTYSVDAIWIAVEYTEAAGGSISGLLLMGVGT